MRLLSWNVNGIRAAAKKGFLDWMESQDADIVCIQESKAQKEQLDEDLQNPLGYNAYWHSAQKKGYSGVATFARKEPLDVHFGMGIDEFDNEGRVLSVEMKNFVLINAYFPNSQRDHARLDYKVRFCDAMLSYCEDFKNKGKSVVLVGDYNIAHKEIDLKNPKTNMNNAGFLPEERAWMDKFLNAGYIDTFRIFQEGPGHYTWWSYRPGVREKNIGWRIDYFTTSPDMTDRLKDSLHQPEVLGSDHCPIELNLKK